MDVKIQMELVELKAKMEVLKRFVDANNHGGKYDSVEIPIIYMIMGWGPDAKDEEIAMLREELQNAINDAMVKEADA